MAKEGCFHGSRLHRALSSCFQWALSQSLKPENATDWPYCFWDFWKHLGTYLGVWESVKPVRPQHHSCACSTLMKTRSNHGLVSVNEYGMIYVLNGMICPIQRQHLFMHILEEIQGLRPCFRTPNTRLSTMAGSISLRKFFMSSSNLLPLRLLVMYFTLDTSAGDGDRWPSK